MTSAQVVETSVTNNSSFQNYLHPDDHTIRTTDTPGFKPFTILPSLLRWRFKRKPSSSTTTTTTTILRSRLLSLYVGEIWKPILISTVRLIFHINPSPKRNFSKTLFKPEEFENAGLAFENGGFGKRRHHVFSLPKFFLKHKSKNEQLLGVDVSNWCVYRGNLRFQIPLG